MTRAEITQIFPEASDEQITQILNINGSERAGLQKQLETVNAENSRLKDGPTAEKLQAEKDRADQLQKELDGFKATDALRVMREKVAGDKKIPVNLLTAETEEACVQQADAILAFANISGAYPTVADGGTPTTHHDTPSTGKQFAEWAKNQL